MLCVLGKIGNAGMDFSVDKNADLIRMYNYTCDSDDVVSYVEFQKRISDNCNISDSNVRMYCPFLFYHGFINEYKNGALIKISDYFTPLGKAYIKSLIVAQQIKNETVKEKAEDITKDILALSFFNRKAQNKKDYYFDFLEFCIKYNSIGLKEFNYMLYSREVLKNDNYIDDIAENIQQFRTGDIDFEFLQDRISKKGEQVRRTFPDNTFNYTRSLLLEAGLIVEIDSKEYKINPNKKTVVQLLVKEDM